LLRLVNLIQQDQGVDMLISELKLVPAWGRIGASISLLLFTGLLLRCGSDDKKKDTPIQKQSTLIPADWDASSDWTGSAWKVTNE
jgi:hypothetical protein